jgi:hypothetical protein
MKLLIIAGPYEADRIRRAAVSAGFETVAVEPGESLSGWISATRPDLIVMAPQIVNADPNVALAKVRAAPRGRVPIFLVGDAADEARFKGLADGFFVRPIAPGDLIEQARARVVPASERSGPVSAAAPSPPSPPPSQSQSPSPVLDLKPLVAQGDAAPVPVAPPPTPPGAEAVHAGDLLKEIAASIDASLDAEMSDAARVLSDEAAEPADEALDELRDESSQKTVEVPSGVVDKMREKGDVTGDVTGTRGHGVPGTEAVALERQGTPAPSERGAIGAPDLAALLGRICAEGLTGSLALRRGPIQKTIVFEEGAPILARSSALEDRMGEMLARQGRLSRDQQRASAQVLANSGRRLGVVLVDMGIIKESELAPLVRRHYEEIIYSLFAWRGSEGDGAPGDDGEWRLTPERPDRRESIRLTDPAPALITEGIRRKYTAERLLRCLGGATQVLRPTGGDGSGVPSTILDRMALGDDERALVPLFDGVRTLEEIRTSATVLDETLYALAWALVVLRGVVPMRASTAAMVAPRPSAPPIESDQPGQQDQPNQQDQIDETRGARRRAERERAIDRARVLFRYALVQEGDYFQLLGLSREATSHEVRRAYQSLARELSVQAADAALVAELGEQLRAVRTVVDEALRVLGDPRMRRRYQAHLPDGSAAGRPE